MDSSLSKGDIEEFVLEMRSLSKMMRGKAMEKRPKFPYKCKNGSSCPFSACGSCWFVHDDDALPIVSPRNVKASNTPVKPTRSQEPLQNKLTIIADFEKKLVDLSKSIDHRLAAFESKLDAMADAIFKNETDLQEMQEEKAVSSKPEELRQNMDDRIDEKLEIFMKESVKFGKFRSELAADLDNKVDIKLVVFLATDVRTSFENAMQAFAAHVDDRVQIIEGKFGLVDDGDGGLKVKDNG